MKVTELTWPLAVPYNKLYSSLFGLLSSVKVARGFKPTFPFVAANGGIVKCNEFGIRAVFAWIPS
jgi:hypothetical protein